MFQQNNAKFYFAQKNWPLFFSFVLALLILNVVNMLIKEM